MQLSCNDENLLMGNFMTDFVNLNGARALPIQFQDGVKLHRIIDSFTDNHRIVAKTNTLFHSVHHKYAPVVTDILFDYCLAKNWEKYDHRSLAEFCEKVYKIVLSNLDLLPSTKHSGIRRMIADDFLVKYTTIEGLDFVFEKMDLRSKYQSNFNLATKSLIDHETELDALFNEFYPDLVTEVARFCGC
jgi:acyl carrier protein phosphodiesterase